MSERPWLAVSEVFDHFGYKTQKSALNAIHKGTFPVETFVVGGIRAVHRAVYQEYFHRHQEVGLSKLRGDP